ncbi:hypothetical protein GCM10010519_31750 [Streptomyces lactacystinicus]
MTAFSTTCCTRVGMKCRRVWDVSSKGIAEAAVQEASELLAQLQQETVFAQVSAGQTIREAWATAGLDWRRAIVRLVVERVVVNPGHPGGMT